MARDIAPSGAATHLIGAPEAAIILGVDKSTVTRWAANDRLDVAARLRGALVFNRADVEALAASRAKEAAK